MTHSSEHPSPAADATPEPLVTQAIFEQSPDGMLLLEGQRIAGCNAAALELLGYEGSGELLGLTPAELSPAYQPDGTPSAEKARLLYHRAMRSGPQRFEWVHCRGAGGCDLWLEVLLTPLQTGRRRLCHAVLCDISQRKEMERRLQLSAKVFTATRDGILITDEKSRILQVNEAFTRITGYSEEEVRGRTPRVLQSGHHDADFYRAMWSCIRERGSWSGELWDRAKSGTLQPKWSTINQVTDAYGRVTNYIAVLSDLTELKRSQARLQHQAYHDALTGLPNRLLFKDRLARAIERTREAEQQLAVLFIDVDHFKDINDSLGHTAGDRILRQIAQRLQEPIGPNDTLARLSGDEFAVCLGGLEDQSEALACAESLHQRLARPLQSNGQRFQCRCSVGICLYPDNGDTVEELLRGADSALHNAKSLGRNTTCFYAEELTERAQRRLNLAQQIRLGLERDEFAPFYQQQVELSSGNVIGLEVLVRWHHPERGLVAPGEFIPVAEELGLMAPLGATVLRSACRQAQAWLQRGCEFGRIAVNLSAAQLQDGTFHTEVERLLEENGLPGARLELEITESAFMALDDTTLANLQALRQHGVRLSIDDFGTGYSSLLYLKRLPIDQLKIDKGFIWDMGSSPESRSIVQAILELATVLGLDVVAEGVETEEQREQLSAIGCMVAQGFLWGRPVPQPSLASSPPPALEP
ncbi:EAL domain-containing protein [Halorhodospira neutriphila]|uniref:Diguanylate cyclase/phosphodiesterase with PAS/PAC sensor(S) n=1 Tax=Halorhodospira neutriphila TaxID=168379 RepID=A0ABS1E6N2_9GAMM|nr:hypothetical protein [Halorhodospira neutriphila]